MTKEQMREILSTYLAKFRSWPYSSLAEHVESDRHCLEHVEDVSPDGKAYQMEFNAFWDDKPDGNIRVCGDLSAVPQRPLLGFLPIYQSDVTDSFIMRPDGTFVGEGDQTENGSEGSTNERP